MKHTKEKTAFFASTNGEIVLLDGDENLLCKTSPKDENFKEILNNSVSNLDTIIHADLALFTTLSASFSEENKKRFGLVKKEILKGGRGKRPSDDEAYAMMTGMPYPSNDSEDEDEEDQVTAIEDCTKAFAILVGEYNKRNMLKKQSLEKALDYYGIEIDGDLSTAEVTAAAVKQVWDTMNPFYYSE